MHKNKIRLIVIISLITLTSCSSSEEEVQKLQLIQELTIKCTDDFYNQGIYNKQTRLQVTRESDSLYGRMPIEGGCKVKAELFIEGYDVLPIIQFDDLRKFILLGSKGFESYYKSLN